MKALTILCGFLLFQALPAQDLYDLKHIPEIRIEFEEPRWAEVLDSLKESKKRLTAKVTIDGQVFEGVGARFKGNSSYYNVRKHGGKKLPFNLKANFNKKKQRFPGGYKTLKLSNVFRDPSFLREVLSYEIARDYMPAPKCNFARVWVNGEYLGLYNNSESIDEHFLEGHFGQGENTLIKCDPNWRIEQPSECPQGDKSSLQYLGDDPGCYAGLYEMKSDDGEGWDDLIHLTKILNQHPDSLPHYLNVDAALWMHAFNNVLVNLDSYTGRLCHNYYLYETPDGRFTPLVWDMNLSFGAFRFDGVSPRMLENKDLQKLSPFLHYKTRNPKRPLIVQLLAVPLYRKIYIGHIRTILQDHFLSGRFERRARELHAFIAEEVEADPNKLYDYQAFERNLESTVRAGRSEIIGLLELMEARTQYLANHPLMRGEIPEVTKVEHFRFDTTLAVQATLSGAERAFLAYRCSRTEPFTLLEMFDDSGHNDQMAGDGVWGGTLPYSQGLEYYVIAEGERLAVCAPKKASFECFQVE